MADDTFSFNRADRFLCVHGRQPELKKMEFPMSRSWIRLSIVCLACGTLLLAAHAADPAKPSSQSSEPTPVDGTNEPTPVEAAAGTQPVEAPEGLTLVPESEQAEDKGPWEVTREV